MVRKREYESSKNKSPLVTKKVKFDIFSQREEAKWHSELKNLQDSQREEFRTWIQQIRDDMENGTEGPVSRRIRAMSDLLPPTRREVIVEEPKLEESFTIHLGN